MASTNPATYTISERDFVAASKLNDKPSVKHWVIYGVAIAALLWVYVTNFYEFGDLALGALIGVGLSFLILHFFGNPYKAKRFYRNFPALQDEFTLTQLAEGVEIRSKQGVNLIPWTKIQSWKQNKDFVLIYPNARAFYIIPKHITEQGFDGQALIQALETKIGKAS